MQLRMVIGAALLALALVSSTAAAQGRAAPAVLVTVREALGFSEGTPEARARRQLSIELESRRLFRCNLPDWPVSHRAQEGAIVIDLGRVRTRRGVVVSPCSFDRAPAQASVALPTPGAGSYDLVIRHVGHTDRYTLTISDDAIRLTERRVTFSRRRSPELLTRVPPDAIAVFCAFGQNRTDCVPRGPSCDELFADPVIASAAPLPRPAAPYATRELDNDLPHYLATDLAALRARLEERYRDETGCLVIQIVSGRGDLFWNR